MLYGYILSLNNTFLKITFHVSVIIKTNYIKTKIHQAERKITGWLAVQNLSSYYSF